MKFTSDIIIGLEIPVGFEKNLPVRMLLTEDHLQDEKLIQLGSTIEKGK